MRSSQILPLLAATIRSSFAAPSRPDFANTTTLPTHFGLLLFPHFQALDVFGPMDVLNSLSMLYSDSTTMQLTILSKTLEPVSTAMKGMHGQGEFGESVVPTTTFKKYLARSQNVEDDDKDCDDGAGGHAIAKRQHHMPAPNGTAETNKGDIEVLIVPGGGGTRQNMTEEIAFVKELYPKVRFPLYLRFY